MRASICLATLLPGPRLYVMDFFHFGPSGSLFGSYVPGSAAGTAPSVAVLCYPMGQEYMRAHRAFRQIAMLLGRRGIPVFRFDYRGTGDSAGEPEDAELAHWVDDVRAAIDEARRRSGCTGVRLVGLRLGATIAAMAAVGRTDVEQILLWDPVVDGVAFLEELDRHAERREGDIWWVHGFPVPARLREDLRTLNLCNSQVPVTARVIQMISHASDEFDAFAQARAPHLGGMETRVIPSPSDWNYHDSVGGILIPREMVRGIVDAVAT